MVYRWKHGEKVLLCCVGLYCEEVRNRNGVEEYAFYQKSYYFNQKGWVQGRIRAVLDAWEQCIGLPGEI
jgi:hypothetical protein